MTHSVEVFTVTQRTSTSAPYRNPQYGWRCTCEAVGERTHMSRKNIELEAERHLHTHRAQPDPEPDHTPTYHQDEMGMTTWSCACQRRGQLGGHPDERRARQAHTYHAQAALLAWYAHLNELDTRQRQANVDFQARFTRLSPEGQQHTIEKGLAELL